MRCGGARTRRRVARGAAGLGLLLAAAAAGAGFDWRTPPADYDWSFPRDHWAHEGYRTEWWYFTGHLATREAPSRRFGYQLTLFKIGLLTEPPPLDSTWVATDLAMGHAAVTEIDAGRHRFSELLYRAAPLLAGFPPYPEAPVAWALAPPGTEGRWSVAWNGAAFDLEARDDAVGLGLSLATHPKKPLVFQGPNGLSRKGRRPGAVSLYYSFTRLATEGTLVVDGRRFAVVGESWMDKEIASSQLSEEQVGWDWFGLQLDDGREIMLYLLRRRDGGIDFARGTLVDATGTARFLASEDFRLEVRRRWRSPHTGAVYPAGWRLRLPAAGIDVAIVPLVDDQENRTRRAGGLFYWEGAVELRDEAGRPAGRGYVELTGYGENNRPPV